MLHTHINDWRRFFLLCLLATVLCAQAQTTPPIPTFTIAVPYRDDVPPYLWRDASSKIIVGSTIDTHELIAKPLGYQLKWRFYHPANDLEQIRYEFENNEIDLLLNYVPHTINRQQLKALPIHFYQINLHSLVKTNSPLRTINSEELPKYRGVITSMFNQLEIKPAISAASFQHFKALPVVPYMQDTLEEVLSGRADYTINEHSLLSLQLHKKHLHKQLTILPQRVGFMTTTLWFKKDSRFSDFTQAYTERGTSLSQSGRLEHIKERNMRRYINQIQ